MSSAGSADASSARLLLFLNVNRVLSQTGAVLLDLQFLTTAFAAQGVVIVPSFLANEVHNFQFLFAFCHGLRLSQEKNRSRVGTDWSFISISPTV